MLNFFDKMSKDIKTLSDEDLVLGFQKKKNKKFFNEIYVRYHLIVLNRAMSILKDQSKSEDVAHDVFLKLFFTIGKYESRNKFKAWFSVFTYNMIFDYLRSSKKEKTNIYFSNEIENHEKSDDYNSVEESEIFEIKYQILEEILEKINPEEKLILLMKYKDEMSVKDVCSVLELGSSAVKMRLKRAKAHIVEIYQNEYSNDAVKSV